MEPPSDNHSPVCQFFGMEVSFVVRHNGAITDREILLGLHPDIDAEVGCVVNKMPRWEPGTLRGEDVSVQFNMPVRFYQ